MQRKTTKYIYLYLRSFDCEEKKKNAIKI